MFSYIEFSENSIPCLCVSPKFLKYPADTPVPVLTNRISSIFTKWKSAASQLWLSILPFAPISKPFVTTCSKGGSATKALGNRQGAVGEAQDNYTGAGVLFASL